MNPIIDTDAAYALSVFALSCLLGTTLSAFYGFFKILRIAIRFSAGAIAVQDFVFWFFSGLAVFLFALWQNDGIVRGYILTGALIGALAWHLTIGELITRSAAAIVGFFRRISGKIKTAAHRKIEKARMRRTAAKMQRKDEKERARLKREAAHAKKPRKRLAKKKKTLEFDSGGVV